MKNLSKLMLFILLVLGYNNINAQDKMNPWQITIGVNAIDEYPSGDEGVFSKTIFDQYFNVKDHWNFMPTLSTLTISKYITGRMSFGVTGSLNQISKRGDISEDLTNRLASELTYYGVDGTFKFNILKPGKTLDPFIGIGGGYVFLDEVDGSGETGNGPTANGALGLNIWFNKVLGLTIQSAYKHSFGDIKTANDLNTHFQHSIGISIKFGGIDTDNDGILDKKDACPETPGIEAFNGCPDTDADGVEDSKDDCPDIFGLAEFKGCPDSDKDGVEDKNDNCPEVAGLKTLGGCPDGDADGVADGDDDCATEAGPIENKGCPWVDTDGDSVLDKDDKCIEVKGLVANDGCPEVTVEVQKTLNQYAKTILFDTGKASIKKESAEVLADIVKILNEYKNAMFTIEGHTDNVGNATTNQKLSDSRAKSVKEYLIANGIDASRLTSIGYGSSKPIDSNKTKVGKENNRRVEINLVK